MVYRMLYGGYTEVLKDEYDVLTWKFFGSIRVAHEVHLLSPRYPNEVAALSEW